MPSDAAFGRQSELLKVQAFLDGEPVAAAALAITGIAGIGKTTIWRHGVQQARSMGYQVLTGHPTGSETRLSFSGLADLLATVSADVFAALPGVQGEALEIALLRRDVRPSGQSGRVVATALLSVLQALAAKDRVLVAVDDAQWLDAASSDALSFAVRRLDELPVRTLVSVRVDGYRPSTFEQALPIGERNDIVLGPLSTAALHDVIKGELDQSLPRPLVVQIAVTSGGNPLYAVEIARELGRTGIPSPGTPLRVPEELMTLVRARVSRLPTRTRDALLMAASLSQPTVGLVDADALARAEESGIVVIEDGGRISFTHPLLAAAVHESASGPKRRSVHRDLAARLADPEERARHLGLAADGPNEDTAAELEAAADHAAARGAAMAACDLYRRALELTVDPSGERASATIARSSHTSARRRPDARGQVPPGASTRVPSCGRASRRDPPCAWQRVLVRAGLRSRL